MARTSGRDHLIRTRPEAIPQKKDLIETGCSADIQDDEIMVGDMAGQIRRALDSIISRRAHGDPTLVTTTKTKILLKGVDPDRFDAHSPDDPVVLAKVQAIARDLGVSAY